MRSVPPARQPQGNAFLAAAKISRSALPIIGELGGLWGEQKDQTQNNLWDATMELNLDGKTAVITGGSAGIGKAIALGMGRCGASVVVNYCRSEAEAEQTASEIKQAGGQTKIVQADLGDLQEAVEGRGLFRDLLFWRNAAVISPAGAIIILFLC